VTETKQVTIHNIQ